MHTAIRQVERLREGDLVDLASCPYLKNHPSAEFQFAQVSQVLQETPQCTVVYYEDIDAIGYPVGTTLKIAVA